MKTYNFRLQLTDDANNVVYVQIINDVTKQHAVNHSLKMSKFFLCDYTLTKVNND